jgi:hypothetical protein
MAWLGSIYPRLCEGTNSTGLGGDYFDRRDQERLTGRRVRRLEGLGLKVTLEPGPQVA